MSVTLEPATDSPAPPTTQSFSKVNFDSSEPGTEPDITLVPEPVPNLRVGRQFDSKDPIADPLAEPMIRDDSDIASELSAGPLDGTTVEEPKRDPFFRPVESWVTVDDHLDLPPILLYMPQWVVNKKEAGSTKDNWVTTRPEMFFLASEMDSIELAAARDSHVITKNWCDTLLAGAKVNSPMTVRPYWIVGSDSMGYDTSNVCSSEPDKWAQNLAMSHYLIAQIGHRANGDGDKYKVELSKCFEMSASISRYSNMCPSIASAGVKMLRGILWMVKHRNFKTLSGQMAKWYTGVCANKNPRMSFVSYKKRTKGARKSLFGDAAEHVWGHYYKHALKPPPGRVFPAARRWASKGATFAAVAAGVALDAGKAVLSASAETATEVSEKTASSSSWLGAAKVTCSVGLKRVKQFGSASKGTIKRVAAGTFLGSLVTATAPITGVVVALASSSYKKMSESISYSRVSNMLWENDIDSSPDFDGMSGVRKGITGVVTAPVWGIMNAFAGVTFGIKKVYNGIKSLF